MVMGGLDIRWELNIRITNAWHSRRKIRNVAEFFPKIASLRSVGIAGLATLKNDPVPFTVPHMLDNIMWEII
jgi:hypothetical protein